MAPPRVTAAARKYTPCPTSPFSPAFFFNDTATTEIYTLSLHDALPICLDANENPVVNPKGTTLTTNAGGSYTLGANGTVALSDIAHLAGGTSNATGTITFKLYSDAGCLNQVDGNVTAAVAGADGKDYTSPSITVSAAGTYHWVASYHSGDDNNSDSATACL